MSDELNVLQRSQRIVVEPVARSVSILNAGPIGPTGATGGSGAADSIYNVMNYGAVGDGTTNDRNAIQDAIDAAEADGGGVVYFPQGTYQINSALDATSKPLIFRGVGPSMADDSNFVSRLRFASGVTGLRIGGVGDTASGTVIEHLRLTSQSTALGTDDGIHIRSTFCRIQNCFIENFGRYGVNIDSTGGFNSNLGHHSNVDVRFCQSHGWFLAGIDSNAASFIGCSAIANEGFGFHCSGDNNVFYSPHASTNTDGDYYDNGVSNTYIGVYSEAGGLFEIDSGSSYGKLQSTFFAPPTLDVDAAAMISWQIELNNKQARRIAIVPLAADSDPNDTEWRLSLHHQGWGDINLLNFTQNEVIWWIHPTTHQITFRHEVELDGTLDHDGSSVGFFGTTPVSQPSGVTAKVALQNLGLAASVAEPSHTSPYHYMCVEFVADATANLTLTDMTSAEDFLGGSARHLTICDLIYFTDCRLVIRRMTGAAAAGTPTLTLRYATTQPTTTFTGSEWTPSGASCSLTPTSQVVDSDWVAMPGGMKIDDVYLGVVQAGGDGAADPIIGSVRAYFRGPISHA